MPRIRTIKPEFWSSPGLPADPWERLLFVAMWNFADDYGIGSANERELLGFAFPNDEQITAADIRRMFGGIHRAFGVKFYTVGGRPYYAIPSWEDHQKIDRRSARRNPCPGEAETGVPAESPPSPRRVPAESPPKCHESSPSITQAGKKSVDQPPLESPRDPPESSAGSRGKLGGGKGTEDLGTEDLGTKTRELVTQSENAPSDPSSPPEAPRKRGRRLPENWQPSEATKNWARLHYGHLDLNIELDKFCNYWHAESGQKSQKLDWDATFKNWLHNARAPFRSRTNGDHQLQGADLRHAENESFKQTLKQETPQ